MKKYAIFMLAALLMFASTMKAQENKEKKAKGPSVEMTLVKMTTTLSLTTTEQANVKTLLEKQDAEKKQFNKDNDRESADYKPKMKELQKKHNVELKALIGDERFQIWQEIKLAEKKQKKNAE